ncbi:endogenous retrovirus group K member 113 Gag polyprotein-like [Poecile atricapillus]|uniref:endogenous retrovirus group K member 113 Gag polyprotein-like n=1 Tax=Poecile atricapillus TaxID=48891 RepID=UPI002738C6C3|nr:endogenous retrovirus group K member 113 Gag polyprotein-like [Poecile atricapillus]
MGNCNSADEQLAYLAWQDALPRMGLCVSEDAMRALFQWIKEQGFAVTMDNAFDLEVWLSVGDRLWSELTDGDTSVSSLAVTWGALFKALERSQSEDSEAGVEDETVDEWRSASSERPGSPEDLGRGRRRAARQKPPPPGPPLRALPPAAAGASPAPPLPSAGPVPGLAPPLPRARCGCSAVVPALASERRSAPPDVAGPSTSSGARNDPAASPPWGHVGPSPPCPVTASPMHRGHFWDVVKQQALEVGDWELLERLGTPGTGIFNTVGAGAGETAGGLETASAPDDWVRLGWDVQGAPQGAAQAFPVFKATPNTGQADKHNVIAWRVVQDIQSKVAQYGLGSPEVMQIIRVLDTDVLAPFDIRHLAQVLFQPVQFKVFEDNWRQMAQRAADGNARLPAHDPRQGVRVEALMGIGDFSNPDLQARWDIRVLEQGQKIGMGALLKTIEAAAPRARYVTITQGLKEPFLPFVEKIAAALEKQVEDDNLRQLLCKQLARDNANEDCRKIIEALPGDPSIPEMVRACAKVGSVGHKMSALAAALASKQPGCQGGSRKQKNAQGKARQVQQNNKGKGKFLCARCHKPGHFADQCRSRYHANASSNDVHPESADCQPTTNSASRSHRHRGRCDDRLLLCVASVLALDSYGFGH